MRVLLVLVLYRGPRMSLYTVGSAGELGYFGDALQARLAARGAFGDDPFELEPVPLDRWLADPYYMTLGFTPGPEQMMALRHIERVLYPETWDALGWTRADVLLKNLIVLKWGKGSGKDTISQVGLLRIAYLLECLKSPQSYFGLGLHSEIAMLNVAVSAPQANVVFYSPLKTLLETNMKQNGFWAHHAQPGVGKTMFSKNLTLMSGHSDTSSQEGMNLIAGVADEIAEFRTKEELDKNAKGDRAAKMSAEAIDTMLRTSGASRFPQTFKAIYLSWTRFKGDYIEKLYAEGEGDIALMGEQSQWLISHKATWDANPSKKRADFASFYRSNPEDAKAKYECLPPESRDRFFRNLVALGSAFPEKLWTWADGDRSSGPVRFAYVWGADPDNPGQTGWQAVFDFHPDFQPSRNVAAVHIDLAHTQDHAGFAVSHVTGYRSAPGDDEKKGIQTEAVKLDVALGFPPGEHREIELRWCRQLIFRMVEQGWAFGRITLDGYQSVDTIQTLNAALGSRQEGASEERRKIARNYSLDRTTEGYDTFKSMVYGGLYEGYRTPLLDAAGEVVGPDGDRDAVNNTECVWWKEAKSLERHGGASNHAKIDHPPYGSKDIMDAIAGSCVGAIAAARVWGAGDESEEPDATVWSGGAMEQTPNSESIDQFYGYSDFAELAPLD